MGIEELTKKYLNIPNELKVLKRWVCFKVEGMENGKTTKRPYNAISGTLAKVNDELTWSNFNMALNGCVKYNFDGIGFVLGNGIFGIDLDNHVDENGLSPLSVDSFKSISTEFIETLDSYTEYSQSGKGIHIICYGKLPEGGRRKGSVEMYDKGRFFAFTGNAIRNIPIQDRTQEVIPLWEKYIGKTEFAPKPFTHTNNQEELKLDDDELIDIALNSEQGDLFYKYYHDGDISINGNDQSSADMSFCNMLAFWCNGDAIQMDRIFRNSALMREKWDEFRGERTYGQITIETAIKHMTNGFTRKIFKPMFSVKNKDISKEDVDENGELIQTENLMNIDEDGEPIFRIKKVFRKYPMSDTGNALRFYDYFGDLFKYNVTDKIFMFWTGKTWVKDFTNIIRKYANRLIDILREEEKQIEEEIIELRKSGQTDKAALQEDLLEAAQKNRARISNKAGKDAMLSEFQSLFDVSIESSEFNHDDYLLNTESGIVDLETGDILPFDRTKLISKNTNIAVSYEEPETWLKFLYSVFDTGNMIETEQLIKSLQIALGYSLSGSTKEQVMFLLFGQGSNGKSTLTETISKILGDYADNISSSILMQQKNVNGSATYSIAKLQTVRFVETGETDNNGRFAEAQLKILTGSDSISAQFKFGNEFSFRPKFKLWMSTNNMPLILGDDLGIWRRIFIFKFKNTFTGDQKDKNLPDKLEKEKDRILGWCIKGYQKYKENGYNLIEAKESVTAKKEYRDKMDIIGRFIEYECILDPKAQVDSKLLYAHYKEWSSNNAEYTKKESLFSEELQKKGIYMYKNEQLQNIYRGIKIAGFNITG